MGKIVSNFFISLDGVVEAPDQWHFPYFNDEMGAAVEAGVESSEAFLLGRVLYSEWSEFWPQQGPEMEFSSFINEVPKYVVSSTLDDAAWNNSTVISGDVAAGVRDLKDRVSGDITMSGCATTVRWLLAEGLLDELHLLVHPVLVRHGAQLFGEGQTIPLKLLSSQVFETGVLYCVYGPDPNPPTGGYEEAKATLPQDE